MGVSGSLPDLPDSTQLGSASGVQKAPDPLKLGTSSCFPTSPTRLLLDAAPNRGVERKKKRGRHLGPTWEGPRPSGITPARSALPSMEGSSASSKTG
jgi:hypothetical protein